MTITPASKNLSRLMSFALRHHPEKLSLTLNAQGAVSLVELSSALSVHVGTEVSVQTILEVVAADSKQRFLVVNGMIRSVQGHSFPVELELTPQTPPAVLYHGTVAKFMPAIQGEGLKAMQRQFVHLSSSLETATTVGSRRGEPVILSVNAAAAHVAGHIFFLTENKVWLVKSVPAEFITHA